ncbi:MAG: hypothetical protein U0996_10005 [Planctomycetaceae bacterium]
MKRSVSQIRLVCVLLVALFVSGCSLVESPTSAMRRVKRTFTPNPHDWDSKASDDKGEWDFVGDEGRGDQPRERDPDQWFKKYLMSDKANAIERNLGFD